jgi:hypothetical protein
MATRTKSVAATLEVTYNGTANERRVAEARQPAVVLLTFSAL